MPQERNKGLKILILSNKVPYPANDGSSIAIASMIDGLLKNKAQVTLLSLNTTKHYKEDVDIRKDLPTDVDFHQVFADNRISFKGAALNLLSGSPYHVSRFNIKAFGKKLQQLLLSQDFDIVQLEGLAMAVYHDLIRKNSSARVVLRAHNVESQIWQRHIANEKNFLKKAYLSLQVNRLSDFEVKSVFDVDALVAITEDDLLNFRQLVRSKKAISIPCGVDLRKYQLCNAEAKSTDIAYLASMDWLPNRQGAWWFLEKVWPLIRQKNSGIRFHLGGRHMPPEMKMLEIPGVHIHPDVPDMQQFVCSAKLVVVPLLAGSGMRIKILENMALGICQVTTSVGAEGIEVENGKDIVLADKPGQMAHAILGLLNNEGQLNAIGQEARRKAEMKYNNRSLGRELLDFYETEVC